MTWIDRLLSRIPRSGTSNAPLIAESARWAAQYDMADDRSLFMARTPGRASRL
jgi:hypothetical protein